MVGIGRRHLRAVLVAFVSGAGADAWQYDHAQRAGRRARRRPGVAVFAVLLRHLDPSGRRHERYAQCDAYYHRRLGLAQTGLYYGFVNGTYPGAIWHDIVSGNNGDFAAHAGYDNVTGVGSFDGYRYMRQIPKTKGRTPL